jgi:hypothetical protein
MTDAIGLNLINPANGKAFNGAVMQSSDAS